jgi:hypothetical protein
MRQQDQPSGLGTGPWHIELQVAHDLPVELPIFGPPAIENQKGIDEQRQICDKGNVKCVVTVQNTGLYIEDIGEVEVH